MMLSRHSPILDHQAAHYGPRLNTMDTGTFSTSFKADDQNANTCSDNGKWSGRDYHLFKIKAE
jgi:hypothetical protein